MSVLGWSYGHHESAWGPRTSTINFCEQDYYLSPYIAEFINTITNVLYVFLAGYGFRRAIRESKDGIFILTYASLVLVAIGSICFHATLKYSMQLVDELSMLYATSTVLYTIWSFQLSKKNRILLASGLISLLSGLTFAHHFLGESSLHRLVFGSFIVCVFFRTVFLMRTKVTDQEALRNMRKLAAVGSVTFVSGYALWLVDEFCCSHLRNMRAYTGMPIGFILELHGWWHLLTGIGVYCFLVFVEYLHIHINSKQGEFSYSEGDHFCMFPRVFRLPLAPIDKTR